MWWILSVACISLLIVHSTFAFTIVESGKYSANPVIITEARREWCTNRNGGMNRHPSSRPSSSCLRGEVRIRDWKKGDGTRIRNLLRSVNPVFDPEGPLDVDCGSDDVIQESYGYLEDGDGACLLVATAMTGGGIISSINTAEDVIVGTAALIVGTPVTYLKSGASISPSDDNLAGAIRRVCVVGATAGVSEKEKSILKRLLVTVENRALEAGVSELIVLAYPTTNNTTIHRPGPALLKSIGYEELPVSRLEDFDVVQYGKKLEVDTTRQLGIISDTATARDSSTIPNEKVLDVVVGATFLAIIIGFIGVASFMGLDIDLNLSNDNRGIGSPLSLQEFEQLKKDEKLQRTDIDGGQQAMNGGIRQWKDLTSEERREEDAMMKIIQGQDSRLK